MEEVKPLYEQYCRKHKSKKISYINLTPECKEKTNRLMCFQCMQNTISKKPLSKESSKQELTILPIEDILKDSSNLTSNWPPLLTP